MAAVSAAVSLVLTASLSDRSGIPRLPLLWASLARFVPNGTVAQMIIVVPSGQKRFFEDGLVRGTPGARRLFARSPAAEALLDVPLPFPIVLHTDDELIGASKPELEAQLPIPEREPHGRGAGYRLQMLVKLAVARKVQTRFYVTLDLDVFATQSLDGKLVDGARGLVQGEGRGGNGLTQHRNAWWRAAEQILGAPGCRRGVLRSLNGTLGKPVPSIGVTPAVLSKFVAEGCINELERLLGTSWAARLFGLLSSNRTDWSEYTLYWVYACKAGLIEQYHFSSTQLQLYPYVGFESDRWHLWTRLEWHPWEDFFSDQHTVFGVVQSISGVKPGFVVKQLMPFVQGRVAQGRALVSQDELDVKSGVAQYNKWRAQNKLTRSRHGQPKQA